MRKTVITKIWLGGIVAIVLGLVAVGIAMALMFAYGGSFVARGPGYDFVPQFDAYFWTMVAIVSVGGLIALGGGVAQFVAWVGALVNSYQLQDKMWFLLTLILGVVGFELIVMIVYLLAAPDGYEEKEKRAEGQAPLPPDVAPTT